MIHNGKKETKKKVDEFMDKKNYIIYMVSIDGDNAENWITCKDFPINKATSYMQLAVDKLGEKLK